MGETPSLTPKPASGRKLFYGLFIFPLIIAVGMAVLLCTVVLLTKEAETPESLITAIKTGAPSKRWQKAFELSNEINQGPDAATTSSKQLNYSLPCIAEIKTMNTQSTHNEQIEFLALWPEVAFLYLTIQQPR